MAETQTRSNRGRPAIDSSLWDRAVKLFGEGKTVAEVIDATGLGQTKAYEIRKFLDLQANLKPEDQAA